MASLRNTVFSVLNRAGRRPGSRRGSSRRTRPAGAESVGESLEGRVLLATFTWSTDADGNWGTADNWRDENNNPGVPGLNDDVVIDRGAANPTVTVDSAQNAARINNTETIAVQTGGTLRLWQDDTLGGDITLDGGTLNLLAGQTLSGNLEWIEGAINGTVTNTGSFQISGSADKTTARTLNNEGTIVHRGSGNLVFPTGGPGSFLNNRGSGTYNLKSDAGFSGAANINNEGRFRKTGGTGESSVGDTTNFNHLGGTVEVTTGTLLLSGNARGTSTNARFIVAADAVVELTGRRNQNAYFEGTTTGEGEGRVVHSAGTLSTWDTQVEFNFPEGMFQWAGGVINHATARPFRNSGFIHITGASDKQLWGSQFDNAGTIVHSEGNLNFRSGGPGSFLYNLTGATYEFDGPGTIDGSSTFDNSGALRKTGPGTAQIDLAGILLRDGSVTEATDGRLILSGGGRLDGGDLNASGDGVVELAGGFALYSDASAQGTGDGRIEFSAGQILSRESRSELNFAPGLFHWIGGTFGGGGCLGGACASELVNVGEINASGDNEKNISNTLLNAGVINQTGLGNIAQGGSGATLENLTGGLWDIRSDAGLNNIRFRNAGTLRKSGGTGVSHITRVANGTLSHVGGTTEVLSGSLRAERGIDSFGGGHFHVVPGSTLGLDGFLSTTGRFTGTGGGRVEVTGRFIASANDPTVLDFDEGTLFWIGSDADSSTGHMVNDGFLTIEGPEAVRARIYLTNNGTIEQAPGSHFTLLQTVYIINRGVWDFLGDADFEVVDFSNLGSTFFNLGTLQKSGGTGTSRMFARFHTASFLSNLATVDVRTGTLELAMRSKQFDAFSASEDTLHGGTWRIGPGAELRMLDRDGNIPNISMNYGHVILDGPGSAFPNINGLVTNGGTFELQNGRDFETAGSFTNGAERLNVIADNIALRQAERLLALAVDEATGNLYSIRAGQNIRRFRPDSTEILPEIPRPDAQPDSFSDLDFTTTALNLGGTQIPADTLIYISGQVTPPIVYGLNKTTGEQLATVTLPDVPATTVGVALHPSRGSLFVMNQSGAIHEIDPADGRTLNSFTARVPGAPGFGTFWGDLDVEPVSGNLYVVGSNQEFLRELTPTGDLVRDIDLSRSGISNYYQRINPAGLAIRESTGEIWVQNELTTLGRLQPFETVTAGTTTVGPGSTLTVAGDYTQTVRSRFEFAGNAASGLFGTIEVAGNANLAGAADFALVNGFAPGSESYEVMSFAARTGSLTFGGDTDNFEAVLDDNSLRVNTVSGAADLALQSVTVPAGGTSGQNADFEYTVKNLAGGATVATSWVDSVYLSADSVLDSDDPLIARITHTGAVAAGAEYSESFTAALPGGLPGNYHVIVVVDSRGHSPDSQRSNNAGSSVSTLSLDVPELTPGVTFDGNVSSAESFYFRANLATDETPLIRASFSTPGAAEVFVSQNDFPTRSGHDHYAYSSVNQALAVSQPAGRAGVFYILVRGTASAGDGVPFSLLATDIPFGIERIGTRSGSNAGSVSTVIRGSQFTSGTNFRLISDTGQVVAPRTQSFIDNETVWATFDLTNLAPGLYDVRATDAGRRNVLTDAFEVTSGSAGRLVYDISAPSHVRAPFRGTVATVTYSNVGDADLIAPIFTVTGDNARMRLEGQPSWSVGSIEVRALNPDGPADVLPPGASGSVRVFFEPIHTAAGARSAFTVREAGPAVLPESGEEIALDWNLLKGDLRPRGMAADAWDAIFANFARAVGNSFDQFRTAMARNARHLASIGLPTSDLARLMSFELEKAGDFGRIEKNYQTGALGRGYSAPFDARAIESADGSVTIDIGTGVRAFVKTAQGYEGVVDETGTLRKDKGAFVLTELDGTVERFRSKDGRLVHIDDPRSGRTILSWSNADRLTQVKQPNGDLTRFSYNAHGRISRIVDAVGRTTRYKYDSAGERITSHTDASGTTRYSYYGPSAGLARQHAVRSITLPDGVVRAFKYNGLGQLVSETHRGSDGSEITTRYETSSNGVLTVIESTGARTRIYRGPGGVVARTVDALKNVDSPGIEETGRAKTWRDPAGAFASLAFNESGLPTKSTDPEGNTSTIKWAKAHGIVRPVVVTDARGGRTQFGYDPVGNLTSITYPDASSIRTEFNGLGRKTAIINARGQRIGLQYDAAGLLERQINPDGSSVAYTYDAHRNITSASKRDAGDADLGTTTFTYDGADRPTSVSYPNGRALTYTYDGAGRRTAVADQDGFTIGYEYDGFGRLSRVADTTGGGDETVVVYSYDAHGRLVEETRGSGAVTRYGYDLLGRTTQLTHLDASANVIEAFGYMYDAVGRIREMQTLAGTTSYEYDRVGQLTRVELPSGRSVSWSYDAEGNRTQVNDDGTIRAWDTNNVDQYTQIDGAPVTWDADGNLLRSGSTDYTYDAEGRLVEASGGGPTIQYEYDALGTKIAVIEDGVRRDVLVDPLSDETLFAEYTATDSVRYAHGNGVAARISGSGTSWLHFDLQGNTHSMSNEAGLPTDLWEYLPFGDLVTRDGSTPNPFTFHGRFGVEQTGPGLYSMANRDYSAALGRFIQRDPIGIEGGDTNVYRFVQNDPVNLSDPSGLQLPSFGAVYFPSAAHSRTGTAAAQLATRGAFGSAGTFTTPVPGTPPVRPPAPSIRRVALRRPAHHAANTFRLTATNGRALSGVRALGPAGLAAAGGWTVGRGTDIATDYYFPDAKNNFRQTLATQFNLSPDRNSPIYNNGGIHDGRYNEFVRRNLEDPLINSVARQLIELGDDPVEAVMRARQLVRNCRNEGTCSDPPPRRESEVIRPRDPNNIVGPAGFGADVPGDPDIQRVRFDGHITPTGVYHYDIHYENKATATAPAQTVVVTHTLDADLDLTTFELASFGFGDTVVHIPPGRANYATRVDVSDTLNVVVDFEATLDLGSRKLTVTLTSLDPVTLDFPSDPFAGFLSPNVTAPEGDGFIRFTIEPNDGLADGTRIDAKATIIFDTEDPLDTPDVHNTIDTRPPESQVGALPATTTTADFEVNWSGSDSGSGVRSYDVFVSRDGGPYELWLDDTAVESAIFSGEDGRTYAFYTVASDNLSYVEVAPAEPDATTTIDLRPPATISIANAQVTEGNLGDTRPLRFTLTRTDNLADVQVRVSSRSDTAESGTDFAPYDRVVRFPAGGPLSKTVTIDVLGDDEFEPHETLQVVLTEARNVVLADGEATGTIVNDDEHGPGVWRDGDTVYVLGTDHADTALVSTVGDAVVVRFNDEVTAFPSGVIARIEMSTGGGDDLVDIQADIPAWIRAGDGNDTVLGSDDADEIDGGPGRDQIDGRGGDDLARGGGGRDELAGGPGNDILKGGGDRDHLEGGADDDVLFGGNDQDVIHGNAGDDWLDGLNGADELFGGDGHDTIFGSRGLDEIFGDGGNDELLGGGGRDLIEGGTGDDFAHGGSGRDSLFGGADSDVIIAGTGGDLIDGQAGNDLLIGGTHDDRISGGQGRDILIGNAAADILHGGSDQDILIGGSVSLTLAELSAVAAEWNSERPYASRVDNISGSGTGDRENGNTFLRIGPGGSVTDDGNIDHETGNGGSDWFFAGLDDVLNDRGLFEELTRL